MNISVEAGVSEELTSLEEQGLMRNVGLWGMNISEGPGVSGEDRSLGEWASVEEQGSMRNVGFWGMNISVEAGVHGEQRSLGNEHQWKSRAQ